MDLTKYLSLNTWTEPADHTPEDGMVYWRERILIFTLVIFVFFGLFSFVLSLQTSPNTNFLTIVFINTLAYGVILFLFINRKMSYNFRAISTIVISYLLGLMLTLLLGPVGAGPIWLFVFPVLCVIFYNQKIAFNALVLNTFTLILTGFYFISSPQYWKHSSEEMIHMWIIEGINYILLNMITTFSISVILKGLSTSLNEEKRLQTQQKIINKKLLSANTRLTREMNERKEIEKSLIQKNSELNALINSIPDMIWFKDKDSKYITVNNAFYRTTSSSSEDIINRKGYDFFGKGATKQHIESDREVMKTGIPQILEVKNVGSNGNDIWFETIKAPIINSKGISTGLVGIAHDITKRKKIHNKIQVLNSTLEERIEKRTKELVVANTKLINEIEERKKLQNHLLISERFAATGQLASSIAHEINSPLQGIISLLNVIEKTNTNDDELIENINLIKGAFSNIKNTVGDLQNLNRPSENIKRIENVNNIIEQSASLFKSYLKNNKIKFTLDLSGTMQNARVSAQEINQCLVNLVNNAIEAITAAKNQAFEDITYRYIGEIIVKTFMEEDRVMISVQDTGPGIKEKVLDNVFDPFYTHKKQYGMGIGLSICLKIMENHEGTITALNNPEGGAEFRISLPVYKS